MLTANPRIVRRCAASVRSGSWPTASTPLPTANDALREGCRNARARRQRAPGAGKKPIRGADVGTRAKCGRVQHRGARPSLQRTRDAAPAQAARRRHGRRARGSVSSAWGARSSAIFDRNLIIHALENVRERLRQGTPGVVASFVTTAPAGQLVRVQVAPVFGTATDATAGAGAGPGATGSPGSSSCWTTSRGGSRAATGAICCCRRLTQGTRASLGSVRAAVETIAAFPDMSNDERSRFIGVIGDEARQLSARLDATVSEFADALRTEWPLEEMRGADLIAAARRRVESKLSLPTKLETIDEIDLGQRRQLLADAGDHLPGEPARRRVRHPRASVRPRARRRAGAPRPRLDRRAARYRDDDGLADRFDGTGRRSLSAHAEADRRAPQRRVLVPDPQAVAPRVLSDRDTDCDPGGIGVERAARGRQPARVSTTSTCSISRARRRSRTTGRSRR